MVPGLHLALYRPFRTWQPQGSCYLPCSLLATYTTTWALGRATFAVTSGFMREEKSRSPNMYHELEHSLSWIVKIRFLLILIHLEVETQTPPPHLPVLQACPAGSWEIRCCPFLVRGKGQSLKQRVRGHGGKGGVWTGGNTWESISILPFWKPDVRMLRHVT